MIRRPPRSTQSRSSAASDVYKRQVSAANVLLLDEPTNNLDPASREEILYSLKTYEGAVVLVTHDPGAVKALEPDRVLLLPDGDEDLWDDSYLELVTLT